MPNYLARVAAAGARTSTPIRPPVSAPPVMPGPGLFEPTLSMELEAESMPSAPTETGRLLDVQPTQTSLSFEETSVSAPIPELPLGGAPPVPPPVASSVSPAVTRPVEGPAALPPAAPSSSLRAELQREIEQPMIDEVIRVPRSLRPAPTPETLSATAGAVHSENLPANVPVQPGASVPGISGRAAEPALSPALPPTAASVQRSASLPFDTPVRSGAPLPAVHERNAESMPAAVRQHPTPAERLPDLAAAVEALPVTPAAVAPRLEASPLLGGWPSLTVPMRVEVPAIATAVPERRSDPEFVELPQPLAQAGPPEPLVAAQRQSRITIGRLEVQVANHPPPPAARPVRLPGPPDRDILAGLYLDRFRLMP